MMTHGDMTSDEKRIRRLEEQLERAVQAIKSLEHKATQTAENDARQAQQDFGQSRVLLRAQSVGVITASSANVPGSGTARLLQVIEVASVPKRFKFVPDVQVTVLNDTGSATINNEYLIVAVIDGYYTCVAGDCATTGPTAAPTPP